MGRPIGALLCMALLSGAAAGAAAPDPSAIAGATQAIEAKFDCRISLLGEPRQDEFSAKWLVAYSASGEGCERGLSELQHRGAAMNVVFFRRPNLPQVEALIADMKHTVEVAFGCRIVIRGGPRFEEASSQWFVGYFAVGKGCEEAGQELERRGSELQIVFLGTAPRQDLIR